MNLKSEVKSEVRQFLIRDIRTSLTVGPDVTLLTGHIDLSS